MIVNQYHLNCSCSEHIPPQMPQRSIVVARNVQESIVSGYLYHKTGRECWVNENGIPNPLPSGGNDHFRHDNNWASHVSSVPISPESYKENPNFCEVLASAPSEMGLSIYAEIALKQFIRPAVNLRSLGNKKGLVLYVCMEDLSTTNQSLIGVAVEQMRHHLLKGPGGDAGASRRQLYSGTHSTHSVVASGERASLLALVDKIDDAYLKGQLQEAQALFECGPQPPHLPPRMVLG